MLSLRMTSGIQYTFAAELWQHGAPGGWHFMSLPAPISKEIRDLLKSNEEGWGRLKATANIGASTWMTAIWFDTKLETYILPVKADVRQAEGLRSGMATQVTVWV